MMRPGGDRSSGGVDVGEDFGRENGFVAEHFLAGVVITAPKFD